MAAFVFFLLAAEADNLKLLLIQLQITSIKRKICVFTILAQMLLLLFFTPVANCIFTVWVPP
ncbi:MAG: hypothetical protein ACLS4A_07240 [Oscillospiraceae bacterium]